MPNHDSINRNLTPNLNNPDQRTEKSLEDTFPASDPAITDHMSGTRAVHPGDLLSTEGESAELAGGTKLSFGFDDREKAKLAMEAVVRAGLVEASRAQVGDEHGEAMLNLQVASASADAVKDMLEKSGGHEH